MSTTVSMWLGIAFLVLAITAVLLQAWLWGPKFWDEEAKKTRAPKFWLRMHALSGYAYGVIYVVMMWQMLPRLWEYQYELPARTVLHAVFGIVIGVLLVSKIMILVFFRHFEESMPYYGFGILLCTVVLSTLSIPYAVQAHDFSGRTTDPDNVERVRGLLAKVEFEDADVDLATLTTEASFDAGRSILVQKCTVCHDMRTILAKPRTAQKWHDVSYRMLDKPSVFGTPLAPEDIPAVTAYLTAVTPEIQESTKRRRAEERKKADSTETMVDMVHDSGGSDAAKIPAAEGQALLEVHCTDCHELDEIDNHGGDDIAGWRSVVAAMVEEGAEYDAETSEKLIAFLVQAYPGTGEETPMPAEREPEIEIIDEPEPEPEPKTDSAPKPTPKPKKTRKPKPKPKPKPKGNAAKGRDLFTAKCKSCHGSDGKGGTSFGKKIGVKPLSGLSRSRIKRGIANGVPGTKMKPYKSKLSATEIDDLTAFVRRL